MVAAETRGWLQWRRGGACSGDEGVVAVETMKGGSCSGDEGVAVERIFFVDLVCFSDL